MTARKDKDTLNAGLPEIRQSPDDNGTLELIVVRPAAGERTVIGEGRLTLRDGLEGDNWRQRMAGRDAGVEPQTDNQVTLMNVRVIRLLDDDPSRWPLAGDQLYVDLDLSDDNLPPGQRLQVGEAILEVSALPHTGCKMFAERFGVIEAAAENELCAFGNMSDQKELAPDYVVSGPVWHMEPTVDYIINQVAGGTYTSQDLKDFSMVAKGGASLASINTEVKCGLADELVQQVQAQEEEIKSGLFRVDINEAQPPASSAG